MNPYNPNNLGKPRDIIEPKITVKCKECQHVFDYMLRHELGHTVVECKNGCLFTASTYWHSPLSKIYGKFESQANTMELVEESMARGE